MAALQASWTRLQADPKGLSNLQTLASNRHFLPELNEVQVATLLQVLQHLQQGHIGTGPQRSTAFSQVFQLLAQWVNSQLGSISSSASTAHLEQAVAGALQVLHSPWCTAQSFPACLLFLGAASKGLAEHEKGEIAAAACTVLQAHRGQLSSSSEHVADVRTGIADIMISLQCDGSSVMWLLVSALTLWSPIEQAPKFGSCSSAPDGAQTAVNSESGSSGVRYDIIRQAMLLYSMMRQVGAAMLQTRTQCPHTAKQMTDLLSVTLQSGQWQESMAAVLAAAGLLEGLVKGALALPLTSPVVQALCHILTTACADAQAEVAAVEGAQAEASTGRQPGCAHWRDAAALACCNTWQACKLLAASPPVATCIMSCLWDSCLTLKGLFQASALGRLPEEGNAWLEGHVNSFLMQEAATVARIAAEQYRLVNEQSQQACRQILHAGAKQLYEGYRAYAMAAPPAWMQSIDSGSVRQVLDKAFMSGVLLMTAFWGTAAAKQQPNPTATPSKHRSKLRAVPSTPTGPAAVAATRNIPGTTASSAAATAETSAVTRATAPATAAVSAATVETSAATPTPAPATAAVSAASADTLSPSTRPAGQPTSTAQPTLQASGSGGEAKQTSHSSLIAADLLDSISYLQFCRMRLTAYNSLLKNTLTAVSADAQASQQLLNRLPPYGDLAATVARPGSSSELGQGGRQEAVWAADAILATRMQLLLSLLGACLPSLPQGTATAQVAPIMFLYLQHPQKTLAAAAHSLFCAALKHNTQKEELVPFFIKRALEAYPSCTPISGLSAGVDAALRELPSGSPVVLLTLQSLGKHASELLQQSAKLQQSSQAGLDLVKLLAQMLLVAEYQFLPEALVIAQDAVLSCLEQSVQLAACNCINEVLLTSDDYTRKAKCAQWYQQLAASCATRHRQLQPTATDDIQQFLLSSGPSNFS